MACTHVMIVMISVIAKSIDQSPNNHQTIHSNQSKVLEFKSKGACDMIVRVDRYKQIVNCKSTAIAALRDFYRLLTIMHWYHCCTIIITIIILFILFRKPAQLNAELASTTWDSSHHFQSLLVRITFHQFDPGELNQRVNWVFLEHLCI